MPLKMRAHPRSRGENVDPREAHGVLPGSSPLTRGKLQMRADLCAVGGLIPAHAGKTRTGALDWLRRRAHPRSRGEN